MRTLLQPLTFLRQCLEEYYLLLETVWSSKALIFNVNQIDSACRRKKNHEKDVSSKKQLSVTNYRTVLTRTVLSA